MPLSRSRKTNGARFRWPTNRSGDCTAGVTCPQIQTEALPSSQQMSLVSPDGEAASTRGLGGSAGGSKIEVGRSEAEARLRPIMPGPAETTEGCGLS